MDSLRIVLLKISEKMVYNCNIIYVALTLLVISFVYFSSSLKKKKHEEEPPLIHIVQRQP